MYRLYSIHWVQVCGRVSDGCSTAAGCFRRAKHAVHADSTAQWERLRYARRHAGYRSEEGREPSCGCVERHPCTWSHVPNFCAADRGKRYRYAQLTCSPMIHRAQQTVCSFGCRWPVLFWTSLILNHQTLILFARSWLISRAQGVAATAGIVLGTTKLLFEFRLQQKAASMASTAPINNNVSFQGIKRGPMVAFDSYYFN